MLCHVVSCASGRSIVADVAMGETPTHGKMKVSLSPTAAGGNMFIASSCQGSEKRRRSNSCTEGDSTSLEHDKGSYMSNDKSNSNRDEGFATVEWYGTIRLLVFARKGGLSVYHIGLSISTKCLSFTYPSIHPLVNMFVC